MNFVIAAYAGWSSGAMFHGSRNGNWPCARVSGQNAPNSNQRALSSRHSSAASGVCLSAANFGGVSKPPMSVVQYGTPDSENPSPAGICALNAPQLDVMSPDQTADA